MNRYEIAIPLVVYLLEEVEGDTPEEVCELAHQMLHNVGSDIKFDRENIRWEGAKLSGEPWAIRQTDHLMFHVAKRVDTQRDGEYWVIDRTIDI